MLRVALGGAIGTGLRLLVAVLVGGGLARTAAPPGPLTLLLVNTVGAGLLGLVVARPPLPERWMPALTTGVLGGLTTFSTLVVQAGTLGHDAGLVVPGSARMTGAGLALVAGSLGASVVLGLGAFVAGRALGRGSTPTRPGAGA